MSAQNIPILDAYRTGVNAVIWCAHERRWHYHGACSTGRCSGTCTCPIGSADGHRVAHCACPHSPYDETGYILREVGPFTKQVRARHGRQAPGLAYTRLDPCRCPGRAKVNR